MELQEVKIRRTMMSKKSWLDELVLPKKLVVSEEKFRPLWNLHPEEKHKIKIMGNLVDTPRYQQAYLQSYKFSGTTSVALDLPDLFAPYLKWANSMGYGKFNAVLINWYEDGSNYIGAHGDDEKQLVKNSPVVTITLCQPSEADKRGETAKVQLRKFRIREAGSTDIVKDVLTANGSVLIMCGKFQKEFTHEIVKITGKGAPDVGPRISITLRQFKKVSTPKLDSCMFCSGEPFFTEEASGEEMRHFCDTDCQEAFHHTMNT